MLSALPACPMRLSVRVIPITAKPARVRMFMPKRMSLVNTIRLGRTWLDLASHGDIAAFAEPYYHHWELGAVVSRPLAAHR